jgi:flagellar hook-length control protein FliK
MPSIPPDVASTPSLASSPWPQVSTTSPDGDAEPFSAILDASIATPDLTATPPPNAPSPPPAPEVNQAATVTGAANQPGADADGTTGSHSSRNIRHGARAIKEKSNDAKPIRSTTTGTNTSQNTTKSSASNANATDNANSDPSANATSSDATSSPNAAAGNGADINAVEATATATASLAAAAPDKKSSADSTNSNKGDGSAGDDNTDAAATQGTTDTSQPIAAALVANTTLDGPAATANGSVSGLAIGDMSKARAKLGLSQLDDQDTDSSQNTSDATKSAPSADATDSGNTKSNAAGDAANTQASTADAAQQAQAGSDGTATVPGQPNAGAPADTGHAARADTLAVTTTDSAGASGAQSGNGAAKIGADALPNFGFAASNALTQTAAAATPGAPTSTGVPVAGLAVAIASRALAGSNQFDIRLDPPDLGRIDVRLNVDSNGLVTSHITVDRADTLQLLQSQQPQLERALEQAGLQTADNGLQFTLRDQSFAGQNGNSGGSSAQPNVARLVVPDANLPTVATTQIYNRYGLGSGIDIRV